MRIFLKLRALQKPRIPGVAIQYPVIFTNQLRHHIPLTDIGRGHFHRVDIPRTRIRPNMQPLAKMLLVALLDGVHFRVALVVRIFGGGRRLHDGRIHNRAAVH